MTNSVTCPCCTMINNEHEPHCLMLAGNRPIGDLPGAMSRIADQRRQADITAYQARIRQLEAEVAAHVQAMVEQERHVASYRQDLEAMRAAARHVLAQHGYSTPSLAALGKLLAREERA